eukprot:jgi/Chlat1/7752/Chrsp66S07222
MEDWKVPADPNAQDAHGRTPLHLLCQQDCLSQDDKPKVKALLAADADANLQDGFGRAPLSLICAAEQCDMDIVQALVDAGADVKAKDSWGRTALHWCCDRGHLETAKLLLDKGADVNATTNHGDSVLLWAAKAGQRALVELTLQSGCTSTLCNNRGESAASVARDDVIKALLASAEPKPEAADDEFDNASRPVSSSAGSDTQDKAAAPAPFSNYKRPPPVMAEGRKIKISLKKKS